MADHCTNREAKALAGTLFLKRGTTSSFLEASTVVQSILYVMAESYAAQD